jgi:hypothetical protein
MPKDQKEEGQTTQCPKDQIEEGQTTLFVLLALCCLSFFYLFFWHCVVCPSSI